MNWMEIMPSCVRLLYCVLDVELCELRAFDIQLWKCESLSVESLSYVICIKDIQRHTWITQQQERSCLNSFLMNYFLFFSTNRKDCKRCVVIYQKHQNVLQYKESECEPEQNKPASAAISSVIRSDYSRFHGNEQFLDAESTYDELRL